LDVVGKVTIVPLSGFSTHLLLHQLGTLRQSRCFIARAFGGWHIGTWGWSGSLIVGAFRAWLVGLRVIVEFMVVLRGSSLLRWQIEALAICGLPPGRDAMRAGLGAQIRNAITKSLTLLC
jgi:hypothetical protein